MVVEAALIARRGRPLFPAAMKERKLSSLLVAATSASSAAKERDRARRAVGLRPSDPQALRLPSLAGASSAPAPADGKRTPHVAAGITSHRHRRAKQGLSPTAARGVGAARPVMVIEKGGGGGCSRGWGNRRCDATSGGGNAGD